MKTEFPAQVALINACSKSIYIIKLHNHSIICTRQEELGNEDWFPKVITTVLCSVCSQLNNKPRVVVTDAPYL